MQLNVVINKLLRSVSHCFLTLNSHNNFGKMLFSQPHILSIVFPLLFSIKNLHTKLFFVILLIIIFLKFLVVHAGLIFDHTTSTKLISDLKIAFLLVIVRTIMDINVLTLQQVKFMCPVMSFLMKTNSNIKILKIIPLLLQTLHLLLFHFRKLFLLCH